MTTVSVGIESIEVQLINERVTTPAIVRLGKSDVSIQVIAPDDRYIEIDIALVEDEIIMTTRNYTSDNGRPRREKLFSFGAQS